jgi:hypothetical protein
VRATYLIAQLVRELQQVQELESQLAQVQVPQLEEELAQGLVPLPGLVLRLVRALVPHLHRQQLQSQFQQQQSRLRQHEFLSTLQQLAKVLQYQLCL